MNEIERALTARLSDIEKKYLDCVKKRDELYKNIKDIESTMYILKGRYAEVEDTLKLVSSIKNNDEVISDDKS